MDVDQNSVSKTRLKSSASNTNLIKTSKNLKQLMDESSSESASSSIKESSQSTKNNKNKSTTRDEQKMQYYIHLFEKQELLGQGKHNKSKETQNMQNKHRNSCSNNKVHKKQIKSRVKDIKIKKKHRDI